MDFWNSRPAKGILYDSTVNQSNSNYKQKAEYVCSLSSVRNNAWEAKSITYETRKYQQLRIGGKRLHNTTPQQQALGHKVKKFCILQRAHLIVELQLPAITKKEQCKLFYFLTILPAENLRGVCLHHCIAEDLPILYSKYISEDELPKISDWRTLFEFDKAGARG